MPTRVLGNPTLSGSLVALVFWSQALTPTLIPRPWTLQAAINASCLAIGWFPIVSGLQAVADMLEQLSTPAGFGHVYWSDYVNGWAEVVPPEGWTDADTERLYQFLHD